MNLLSPLFGLKYIIEGAENFEKHASFIVAANHQCIFDVYGMAACSSYLKNCTIISKQEISWCGVNGIIGWLSGVIFIKRVYSPETQRKLEEALKKLKEKKFKIWFFPEGYCRNTGEIHPFKKGAFYFAVKAEIPIVPIVFSQAKWFDKVNKRFTGATIILRVLPPVETSKKYNYDNMDQLIETVRNQMTANFKDLQKVV